MHSTLNYKSEFSKNARLYGHGLDGIMTDRPSLLKEWRNEYKQFTKRVSKSGSKQIKGLNEDTEVSKK